MQDDPNMSAKFDKKVSSLTFISVKIMAFSDKNRVLYICQESILSILSVKTPISLKIRYLPAMIFYQFTKEHGVKSRRHFFWTQKFIKSTNSKYVKYRWLIWEGNAAWIVDVINMRKTLAGSTKFRISAGTRDICLPQVVEPGSAVGEVVLRLKLRMLQ